MEQPAEIVEKHVALGSIEGGAERCVHASLFLDGREVRDGATLELELADGHWVRGEWFYGSDSDSLVIDLAGDVSAGLCITAPERRARWKWPRT